jgi:hypothetical protein
MLFDLYVVDGEPGADDNVTQTVDPLLTVIDAIDAETERAADGHAPVAVRKRHREVLVDRDRSRFHTHIIARR